MGRSKEAPIASYALYGTDVQRRGRVVGRILAEWSHDPNVQVIIFDGIKNGEPPKTHTIVPFLHVKCSMAGNLGQFVEDATQNAERIVVSPRRRLK